MLKYFVLSVNWFMVLHVVYFKFVSLIKEIN